MASKVVSSFKACGVTFSYKEDGSMEAEIPGFSYGDFDRHGHLSPWRLSKGLEISLLTLLHDSPKKNTETYIRVTIGQRFKFIKELYDRGEIIYPMIFVSKIGSIGKTSVTQIMQQFEKSSGTLLMTSERLVVYIDKNTKMPVPVPETLKKGTIRKGERMHIDVQKAPTANNSVFVSDMSASYSDCDSNGHVNSSSYIRWMMDAAEEALASDQLIDFDSASGLCVEEMELIFLQECFACDAVKVYVWVEKSKTLCFDIVKSQNKKTICFGRIKFFNKLFQSKI